MRILICAAVMAGALACGANAVSAQTAAAAPAETQAQYQARCRRETLAANPQARNWVDNACVQSWQNVAAAGPMAEAILSIIPATPGPIDAAGVRAHLTGVRWAARPDQGSVATGRMDGLAVNITRAPAQLGFLWSATGEPIGYDVEQALRGRGAQLALVGCLSYGAGESTKAFRASAPGHAPFGLIIYAREAPTADAESTYSASIDLSGRPATLAQMRANPNYADFAATCPS
jgi:hypothetical protein